MAKSVYFLYLAKTRPSWFQLPEKEQAAMVAKLRQSVADVGGKSLISPDCSWSSGRWDLFGVEEYPNIEALQKHIADQRQIGFTQHVEEQDFLGTPA
jgi:hypothetical protein